MLEKNMKENLSHTTKERIPIKMKKNDKKSFYLNVPSLSLSIYITEKNALYSIQKSITFPPPSPPLPQ